MPKSSLPTAADLVSLFANLPQPITLPAGFDATDIVNAAISEWNRRTRYRPFFQTSTAAVSVPFDPPGPDQRHMTVGGSASLLLPNGLLRCDLVKNVVNPINAGSGQNLVLYQDYWLLPTIAPTQDPPEPWTEIKFSYVQRGLPQSIVVTGMWGYCKDEMPDDAWLAMLYIAAANAAKTVLQGIYNSPTTVKDGDTSITQDSFRALGDFWASYSNAAVFRYRLAT